MSMRSGPDPPFPDVLDFLRDRTRETGGGGGIGLPELPMIVDFPLAFDELDFRVALVAVAAVPRAWAVGVEALAGELAGALVRV
jgi:hypothetical protein